MQALYPSIKPYVTHRIKVDPLTELYVEESGIPHGIAVVVIHGGPGAGSHPDQRRFFDPNKYRIVLFDQRGCGQSTPPGELKTNTTPHLITDMEVIREKLGIHKWVLFGGSWGSTLSLLYAQAHPERVNFMILRSIFLANQDNYNWFFKNGTKQIFPIDWREFIKAIPYAERTDILAAYHKLLHDDNEFTCMGAAKTWSNWNNRCATINRPIMRSAAPLANLRSARIEVHYFTNRCFIEENQILNNMLKIRDINSILIHGNYDMVCPLSNAFELHERWSKSKLEIIPSAGHSSSEPPLADALIRATNEFAQTGKKMC